MMFLDIKREERRMVKENNHNKAPPERVK